MPLTTCFPWWAGSRVLNRIRLSLEGFFMSPAQELDRLRSLLIQAANDGDSDLVNNYLRAIRVLYQANPEFAEQMEAERLARARL